MLVAIDLAGKRTEASRNLSPADYTCPLCHEAVILKRGRVKIAHFAHKPGTECEGASESLDHLQAKITLADQFRSLGYLTEIEEQHPEVNRRVDVAVTVPTGHRIAIEVQESSISPAEIERRNLADQRSGFYSTVWVFTARRAAKILSGKYEVRIPEEMRWLDKTYRSGIFVIENDTIWHCRLNSPHLREHDWYTSDGTAEYSSYIPKTLRQVSVESATFKLTAIRVPYSNRFTVIFAPSH